MEDRHDLIAPPSSADDADDERARDDVGAAVGTPASSPPAAPGSMVPRAPRRFVIAALVAALAGLMVVLLITLASGVVPTTRHFTDDFFDAQAHALLAGHWDVPPEVVGGEGITTPHGTQIYFGVAPVIVRLPFAAVTSSLDGHLAPFSTLAAFGVLLFATARLLWFAIAVRARTRREDARALGAYQLTVVMGVVFLVSGCSTATFLAPQATVFAEAILWSAALAVLAADQFARLQWAPTMRRAILASTFAALCLNTRIIVGIGLVAAMGIVAIATLLHHRRASSRATGGAVDADLARGRASSTYPAEPGTLRRWMPSLDSPPRFAAAMLGVLAVGVLVNVGVNQARFGHPTKVPFEDQVILRFDQQRLALFQQNPGPFAPGFASSDAPAYWRPDGVQLDSFPFISYRDPRELLVGDVVPTFVEQTASVPAAMTGLFALAIVGVVGFTWRPNRGTWCALRLPLLGVMVPAVGILFFGSLAHRYTGDVLPVLVVLGVVGGATLAGAEQRAARASVLAVGGVLIAWGVLVTTSLAVWTTQHNSLHNRPGIERTMRFVSELQAPIPQSDVAPPVGSGWDQLARPDCARVYVASLNDWYAFERAPGTGAFHVRVAPPPDDGAPHALVATEDGAQVAALRNDAGKVHVVFSRDGGRTWTDSSVSSSIRNLRADGTRLPTQVRAGSDGLIDLVVDFDWYLGTMTASGDEPDSFLVLRAPLDGGAQPVALVTGYPGRVETVDEPAPQCTRWTKR